MKHIEDLSKDQMIHLTRNLHKMRITEKIDGSNLTFGYDENGVFYTSRTNKGRTERYYSHHDYEDIPVNNTFKAAHAALSAKIGDEPIPNTQYEVEILFGRQPNAIVYGSNRIVFIQKFPRKLPTPVTISTNMIFSDTGLNTRTERITSTWSFDAVPEIDVDGFNIDESLSKDKLKLVLVEKILRQITPAFRDADDVESHEDFGVEGIVIEDPDNNIITKLVDKQVFTLINQFNFAIRNELKTIGPRFNPANNKHLYQHFTATVGYQQISIYDTLLDDIASFVGIHGLGKYMTITRTLRKYDTVNDFTADWNLYDIDGAKAVFDHAVCGAIDRLDTALGTFNRQWTTYELVLTSGKVIRYTEEIYKRTLVVFAEILRELNVIRQNIAQSTTWEELARAIYGKQMQLAFPD